jgi:hypothetical protein
MPEPAIWIFRYLGFALTYESSIPGINRFHVVEYVSDTTFMPWNLSLSLCCHTYLTHTLFSYPFILAGISFVAALL